MKAESFKGTFAHFTQRIKDIKKKYLRDEIPRASDMKYQHGHFNGCNFNKGMQDLYQSLKSAQTEQITIPVFKSFNKHNRKVNIQMNQIREAKEFVVLRFKEEKGVVMPHEYKIILIEYMNMLFKGMLMESKDDIALKEIQQLNIDKTLSDLKERHILFMPNSKFDDYQLSVFYNEQSQEFISPFWLNPQIKNYDSKLEKIFEKLKNNPGLRLTFVEDLERRNTGSNMMLTVKKSFQKVQDGYPIQGFYDHFHNVWHNTHKVDLLMKKAH